MACLKLSKAIYDTKVYNTSATVFKIDDIIVLAIGSEDSVFLIDFERCTLMKRFGKDVFKKKEFEIKTLVYQKNRLFSIFDGFLFFIYVGDDLRFSYSPKIYHERLFSSEQSLVVIEEDIFCVITKSRKEVVLIDVSTSSEVIKRMKIGFPCSRIVFSNDLLVIAGGDLFSSGIIEIRTLQVGKETGSPKMIKTHSFETKSLISTLEVIRYNRNIFVVNGDDEGNLEIRNLGDKSKNKDHPTIHLEGWVWNIVNFKKYLFLTSNKKESVTVCNFTNLKQKDYRHEEIGTKLLSVRNGKFILSVNGGKNGSKILSFQNLLFTKSDQTILDLEDENTKLSKKVEQLNMVISKKDEFIRDQQMKYASYSPSSASEESFSPKIDSFSTDNELLLLRNEIEILTNENIKLQKRIRLSRRNEEDGREEDEGEEEEEDYQNDVIDPYFSTPTRTPSDMINKTSMRNIATLKMTDYEIKNSDLVRLKTIGSGVSGFVNVCLWNGKGTGIEVVVKEIHLLPKKRDIETIKKEFYTMMKLNHPRVINVYGYSYVQTSEEEEEEDTTTTTTTTTNQYDIFKIVMEKMDMNLYSYVVKNKLTIFQKFQLMKKMTQAISYLHMNNVLHRDIKSFNFLISRDGQNLKISDFGMSKSIMRHEVVLSEFNRGTARWKAPETIPKFSEFMSSSSSSSTTTTKNNDSKKVKYTYASDLFSLGMTFYEVMFERIPFYEITDDFTVLVGIKQGDRPNLRVGGGKASKYVPKELEFLLSRLWHHEPEERGDTKSLLLWFDDFEEIFKKKYSNIL